MAKAKFLEAWEFRAKLLGITPEQLAREQEESLEASEIGVGGLGCLDSEELAEIVEGAEPSPEQTAHLKDCPGCQTVFALLKDSAH